MKKQILWITETAVMLALLVTLQALTRSAGQYVTGSCVNLILAVTTLAAGLGSGAAVALLSPFFAFLLGIGPQLLPIVPAISVGNLLYVLLLWGIAGRNLHSLPRKLLAWLGASGGKAAALYLLVVRLLCAALDLPQKQVAVFTAMFSWPQLVTALAGGGVALLAVPIVRKALGKS